MNENPESATQQVGAVVVGVDGSESADEALAFALAEARRRGSRLHVVTAWHISVSAFASELGPAAGFDPTDLAAAARHAMDEVLIRAGDAVNGIEIETSVREGHAADVLVDESAGADLLIVGSRGLGGFGGLLLGSVSQQCAHHARCPVVIIRSAGEHRHADQ